MKPYQVCKNCGKEGHILCGTTGMKLKKLSEEEMKQPGGGGGGNYFPGSGITVEKSEDTKTRRDRLVTERQKWIYLNDIDGIQYEGETLDEAIERSAWCNQYQGFGSRRFLADLMGWKRHTDGVWRDFSECELCGAGIENCRHAKIDEDDNSGDL